MALGDKVFINVLSVVNAEIPVPIELYDEPPFVDNSTNVFAPVPVVLTVILVVAPLQIVLPPDNETVTAGIGVTVIVFEVTEPQMRLSRVML